MMELDETIKHCLEVTNEKSKQAKLWKSKDEATISRYFKKCAADHRQLAEWLTELKDLRELYHATSTNGFLSDTIKQLEEAKRLLKMAVPIINNSFPEVGSCWGCANHDEVNDECKEGAFAECADVCKWKYADEALKLIGEDEDVNT